MQQENQQLLTNDMQRHSKNNLQEQQISCINQANGLVKDLPSLQHLLDLPENCIVTDITDYSEYVTYQVDTIPINQLCPTCGSPKCVIQDYYKQSIHDVPILAKPSIMVLNKR